MPGAGVLPSASGPEHVRRASKIWPTQREPPSPRRLQPPAFDADRGRRRPGERPSGAPRRWSRPNAGPLRRRRRVRRARARIALGGLLLRRLGALARPRLVELDAPLAVVGLHERQARAERAAAAALEAGHRLLGAARRD